MFQEGQSAAATPETSQVPGTGAKENWTRKATGVMISTLACSSQHPHAGKVILSHEQSFIASGIEGVKVVVSKMDIRTPKSVFIVVPASPEDLPHIARLQFQACADDPGFSAIFPNPMESTFAHLTRQYEEMMDTDPTAHMMITKEITRGEIVAYAVWHFIPSRPAEAIEKEMLADIDDEVFPKGANIELGKRLIKNSIRKRHEVVSECFGMSCPYAYLAAIGTAPNYRKQGAAAKLMEWGVDRADDQHLSIYIEATPIGEGLYQRFGFVKYDQLDLDLEPITEGQFANTCMIRLSST